MKFLFTVAEGEENFLTEWPCDAMGPEQKKRDKKTEDKPDTIPPNSGFGAWRKKVELGDPYRAYSRWIV